MVIRPLWIGLALLIATNVQAAELTHVVTDKQLGAHIHALAFPSSLRKDLRSGLTNRLLLRVQLREDAQPQATTRLTATVEIALKYDLWDERFHVDMVVNGVAAHAPALQTVDEAVTWLSDLRLPALFQQPTTARSLSLQAEVLLNPIESERMARIREWVKENSSYVPLEGGAQGTMATSGSNAMFNRIFEEYSAGQDGAAQWRQQVVSTSFSVATK